MSANPMSANPKKQPQSIAVRTADDMGESDSRRLVLADNIGDGCENTEAGEFVRSFGKSTLHRSTLLERGLRKSAAYVAVWRDITSQHRDGIVMVLFKDGSRCGIDYNHVRMPPDAPQSEEWAVSMNFMLGEPGMPWDEAMSALRNKLAEVEQVRDSQMADLFIQHSVPPVPGDAVNTH